MISVQLFNVATLLLLPIIIHARIPSTATARYKEDEVDNDLHDRSTVYDINKDIELQISSSSQSSTTHQKQLSNINNQSFTAIFTIDNGNTIQTNNGDSVNTNDIMFDNELLFSEDYWYNFQPLQSLDTKVDHGKLQNDEKRRYKVHRILKQNSIANGIVNDGVRMLQSGEKSAVGSNVVEESNNSIDKSQDANNNSEEPSDDESTKEEEYIELLTNSLLSLVCVTMAALAAGLTMGMLSLDVSILFVCVCDGVVYCCGMFT